MAGPLEYIYTTSGDGDELGKLFNSSSLSLETATKISLSNGAERWQTFEKLRLVTWRLSDC